MASIQANNESDKPRGTGGHKRRLYLINPAFQWKYTIAIVLSVLIVSSFMSIILFGVLNDQARARVLDPMSATGWRITATIFISGATFAALMAGALGIWSLFMTHRISGPMFVLNRNLEVLGKGRFPTHRPLRKKDEFKEIHETFWRAVLAIQIRKKADLTALGDILGAIREVATVEDSDRHSALAALAVRVETMRDETARALGVDRAELDGSDGSDATSFVETDKTVPAAYDPSQE